MRRLKSAAEKAGGAAVPVGTNPVDAIWRDRPAPPAAPVRPHPVTLAGEAAADKLARIRAALAKAKCEALLVSDPHNMAWAFNLRGGDVGHTPLPLGYALIPREGRATLFMDAGKLTPDAAAEVGAFADVRPPSAMLATLAEVAKGGRQVRLEATTAGEALKAAVEAAGGFADIGADPCALMKARKNATELEGARRAHLIDGAAMVRFLCWLAREAPKGGLTEIDAALRLEQERLATGELADLSFPSISAAGPNAALPHYRVSTQSNRKIEQGIYLIDSGGQYPFGTTDITRTLAIGEPTPEMKDRYTRVLKGHVAISRAVSPRASRARSLMPSPARRSGRPGSISTMAQAMALAAISRCMRGRSGFPSLARRRSKPA